MTDRKDPVANLAKAYSIRTAQAHLPANYQDELVQYVGGLKLPRLIAAAQYFVGGDKEDPESTESLASLRNIALKHAAPPTEAITRSMSCVRNRLRTLGLPQADLPVLSFGTLGLILHVFDETRTTPRCGLAHTVSIYFRRIPSALVQSLTPIWKLVDSGRRLVEERQIHRCAVIVFRAESSALHFILLAVCASRFNVLSGDPICVRGVC